jgi:acyl transferase domain-containing protein/acyl carrier protein
MSEPIDRRELLKDAVRAVEQMRERVAAMERAASEPIAVVGIGCRLPGGANTPERFWQLLEAGVDAITDASEDRLPAALMPELSGGPTVRAGFLDRIDEFDAHFFGIAPREALTMDPQHRMVLETSWEALEHAGISADTLRGSLTGVFVGITAIDYPMHLRRHDRSPLDVYFATGSAHNAAAGRVSYLLGLQGPSMAIDTACSSSLTAVHIACQSLRLKESHLAIAAGVNTIIIPDWFVSMTRWGMLAPDGRCKAFDQAADGMVRAEGCGVIVLKRLSDALADHDRILAVIRGSAVNQDGPSSGLTVPNGLAQEAVIRQALRAARVTPAQVTYVEAHGTGTTLGDPIELEALHSVFAEGRDTASPLIVGSVKTNLGHLEAASGITGLIKVVLALQHQRIPRHLHFKAFSANVSPEATDVLIPTDAIEWSSAGARIGGVSSFGFSGTNAHVILEEAPPPAPREVDARGAYALTLSARTPEALRQHAARWRDSMRGRPDLEARDLAHTANVGRSALPHRAAVIGASVGDLAQQLDAIATGRSLTAGCIGHVRRQDRPRVAMLFTGQGSQYHGMSRELYATQPVFRDALDRCDALLRIEMGRSIVEIMHGESCDPALVDQTAFTQPALFAFEYALSELWRSWGVEPAAVLGHSVGEYVAACVAGVFSLEDGLKVIAARGRLMQALPAGGEMAAILADESTVRSAIDRHGAEVSVAAINGPEHTVIAGPASGVRSVIAALASRDVSSRPLTVSHAFHSALMDPMLESFTQLTERLTFSAPQLPLVSNLTGAFVAPGEVPDAAYWTQHLRQAVRFMDGVRALDHAGYTTYLEVGPSSTLATMARRFLDGNRTTILASVRRERSAWHDLMLSAGTLFTLGVGIRWEQTEAGFSPRPVSLPTYPFGRQRYWVSATASTAHPTTRAAGADSPDAHPLLGRRLPSPLKAAQFEQWLSPEAPAYLADHVIQGAVVFPASAYVEMAMAAAAVVFGAGARAVDDLALSQLLVLRAGVPARVQTIVTPFADGTALFEVLSESAEQADAGWTLHASATLKAVAADPETADGLAAARARCLELWPAEDLYAWYRTRGIEYGETFANLTEVWRGPGEAVGRVCWPSALGQEAAYRLHPAMVDACMQVLAAAVPDTAGGYIPINIASVIAFNGATRIAWAHGTMRSPAGDGSISGDVWLFDADGRPAAVLLGLRARPASPSAVVGGAAASLLYRTQWILRDAPAAAPGVLDGQWLLVPDANGIGAALASTMMRAGATVAVVDISSDDGAREGSLTRACAEVVRAAGESFRGVVHLCGIDTAGTEAPTSEALERSSRTFLDVVKGLLSGGAPSARICLVTRGAQATDDTTGVNLAQAPAWALARTVAVEHPNFTSLCVDLDVAADAQEVERLYAQIAAGDGESQVALRSHGAVVPRLVRLERPAIGADPERFVLDTKERGILDHLYVRPEPRHSPGPGEVEVRVSHAGLNFRDVLNALGMFRGDAGPLGAECVGTVTAVGPGVTRIAVGDEVLGMVSGSLASHAVVAADLVAVRPPSISAERAVTIPVAFLTAEYCLNRLARIKRGDRVLIHAATGGVGLAAVQLAQRAGAEVFATAGNAEKRARLATLGVEHVFDSRTLDFADEIKERTGGRGVDVVLNSLAGAFIERSVGVLAQGGRFVEIGNTDIWTHDQMAARRPDVGYFTVYLGDVEHRLVQEMLQALLVEFVAGRLHPLPARIYPLEQAAEAFRFMAQARHIGKIVLTCAPTGTPIRSDGTYLITGGFGSLGLRVARHLAGRGARHLALIGRSGAVTPEAIGAVDDLRAAGVEVRGFIADVAVAADLARVITALGDGPELRGVIHAAGVVEDATVERLQWEQFERVFAAKVYGTWHLHQITRDRPLDFFVLFSSASALLGAAGQGNYAAANAFMDGMAHHRRASGLPALSINWGPWGDSGMAATLDAKARQRWQRAGVEFMTEAQSLAILDDLMASDATEACAIAVNWRRFAESLSTRVPAYFAHLVAPASPRAGAGRAAVVDERAPALLEQLEQAPATARHTVIHDYVRGAIRHVLAVDPSFVFDSSQGLRELGMDSLMAVELRNHLQAGVGQRLPSTLAFDCPTVGDLTAYLSRLLIVTEPAAEPIDADSPIDEARQQHLDEVRDLSDADAVALLAQELEK